MRRVLLWLAAGVTLIVIVAASYAAAWLQVPRSLIIRRASASEIGAAMAADRFYSDYRWDTLVITARVANDVPARHEIVLSAPAGSVVWCRLSSRAAMPSPGSTVTVVTVAASAVRRSGGILLADCVLV